MIQVQFLFQIRHLWRICAFCTFFPKENIQKKRVTYYTCCGRYLSNRAHVFFRKIQAVLIDTKGLFLFIFCSFLEMTLCSNLPLALNRIIVRIFLKSLKHFFFNFKSVVFVTNLGKKDVIACIIRQAALSTKDPGLAPKMQTKSYLKAHFKMTCIIWLDFILDQGFEYSSCKIDWIIALKIGCLTFF